MANKVRIGEVVSLSQGFAVNSKSKHLMGDSGLPLLRITDLINGTEAQYLTEETAPEKCIVREDEIIFTRTGQVGLVFRGRKGVVHNNCFKVIPNKQLLEPDYLYWFLKQPHIVKLANDIASGSVQKDLNHSAFKSIEIDLLSLEEQVANTRILNLIEEKIRLNHKKNQTLEQMAQALFKSWFVDFDPVIDNALAAGNDIPEALKHKVELRKQAQQLPDFKPLPDDIRALFPSDFEQTDELNIGISGWIPKGWKLTNIHDMVDTISDTYKLKEVDKVIFLNTGDIEDGKFLHSDYSSTDGLPGQAKKSIAKGDILYSEIRPKNKRYAFVDFDAEEYVVSTKLMVLRAKTNINPLLPYFILTQDKTVNELQHVAEHRSGTFPQITFKELAKVLAVFPQGAELIDLFVGHYLTPLFTKKLASIEQNEQLEKLRDALLPKLISSELSLISK